MDAEFYADFKMYTYLYANISKISSELILVKKIHRIAQYMQFCHQILNKSRNLQNIGIKVYIFEISIKFCVHWYNAIYFEDV